MFWTWEAGLGISPPQRGASLVFRVVILTVLFFFFQAEDGIRDYKVTGVQTCALPISRQPSARRPRAYWRYTHRCPPPWGYARVRAGAMQIAVLMILGSLWSARRRERTPNARSSRAARGRGPARRRTAGYC